MDAAYRERFNRMRQLRESYEEWHRVELAALKRRDFPSVSDAIRAETAIIREQRRVINGLKESA